MDDGGTGSLRWATKDERLGPLDVAGKRLEALHGGFASELLGDSGTMLRDEGVPVSEVIRQPLRHHPEAS